MEYYVYQHTRLKDGSIFYIGKGKGNRFNSDVRRNQYWNSIVKKDGGFRAEILKEGLSNEEACELEIQLINKIGIQNLSNLAEGGNGGNTRKGFTEEEYENWLKNKSDAQKGKRGYWRNKERKTHSERIKQKHMEGKYSYDWLKNPKSEEHKKKISEASKKRIRPMLKCDVCGMEMKTNLTRHKNGKNCKQK